MYGDYGNYGGSSGGNRGGFRGPPRSTAPVNVGDELNVTIEAVGEKGDGIAKEKGFVLFVPNTKEGQVVKIRVTKVLKKVGFAEVIGEGTAAPKEAPAEEEKSSEEPSAEEKELFDESKDSDNFGDDSGGDSSDDDSDDSGEDEKIE